MYQWKNWPIIIKEIHQKNINEDLKNKVKIIEITTINIKLKITKIIMLNFWQIKRYIRKLK